MRVSDERAAKITEYLRKRFGTIFAGNYLYDLLADWEDMRAEIAKLKDGEAAEAASAWNLASRLLDALGIQAKSWDETTPEQIERAIAEAKQAKAIIDKIDKTDDGVPFLPMNDERKFWCVWRQDPDVPWQVGPCRRPEDVDEYNCFDGGWVFDDVEEEMIEVDSVWTTEEAARAAKEKANGR